MTTSLRIPGSDERWPIDTPLTRAPGGALFEVEHNPQLQGDDLRRLFDQHQKGTAVATSGVWRFAPIVHPDALADAVAHPEGNTPLIRRPALAAWAGVDELVIKHEGHNPTGSFKDRGMTVAVTQAVRLGARAVACASTGNTSASLAAYAAQAGIPALVFVPAGQVAAGKMAQALGHGAKTLIVDGDFDTCLSLVQQAGDELGIYLVNSINPFRLEGQKTIVLELLRQLDWTPPDWIVVPAGNLGNTAAFGKALEEAHRWGLISRLPRVAAIQAAGAAPFAAAFARDFDRLVPVKAETVATAIRIGNPASYDRAVRTIRQTGGSVHACSDREILEAKAAIDAAGVGCEPASAASLAGTRALREAGVIRQGESVAAVLTGHLLKDPGALEKMHLGNGVIARPNRPIEVAPTLAAVEAVLRS